MHKKQETIDDKVRKFLSNYGVNAAFQLLVVALAWLFSDFFAPLTVPFWVAIICVLLSLGLIWYRHYLLATGIVAVLIVYVTALALHATYVLATDQQHTRLRQVGEISYLEVPTNSYLFGFLPASHIRQKLISIISCDSMRIAKLPLLPYSPIRADKGLLDSPLPFRRLRMLTYNTLNAYVQTSVGGADEKSVVSFGFGFQPNESSQTILTDLFPRSFACTDNSVPLIPVMEMLPWNPDQSAQLVSAVAKVFSLRSAYLHSRVTLETIRSLDMGSGESHYKSLLDFTSNSLILRMLQGNLFAESRADAQDRLCIIVESDPVAFSGPFSPMREQMKRELARSAGRKYRSAYPACHIDDGVFTQIESEAADSKDSSSWVAAMSRCASARTADELRLCIEDSTVHQQKDRNCDVTFCGAPISGRIPDEKTMRFYEKKFDDYVVFPAGKLIEIAKLETVTCPILRDSAEELHALVWWERRASSIERAI
jgi:hypothetical protein